VNLLGVLIDFPVPQRHNDPDVLGVAQLNYLTGKAVPVLVGSPRRLDLQTARKPDNAAATRGIRAVLDLLRGSPVPVVVNIVGSCRDVALAAQLEPELLAQKCAAIYLNAGSGTPDRSRVARLEYNVGLDPAAYAAIFDVPCPVYWMPCFEVVPGAGEPYQVSPHGTWYRFRQGDVLPDLSQGAQNYFADVFRNQRDGKKQPPRADWLHYLLAAREAELHQRVGAMERSMWCTGGFLHAAGMTVTREGIIVPLAEAKDPVFSFDPIEVTCSNTGITQWQPNPASQRRFIFHVRDRVRYAAAMTSALKSLLKGLP
jgi:hypothetical protein